MPAIGISISFWPADAFFAFLGDFFGVVAIGEEIEVETVVGGGRRFLLDFRSLCSRGRPTGMQ
ncbi:hypothetical protein [Bradyrhizobium sp. CCGB20]|uniref:hypothetical protein n=1 Tax=Bradyrhizobium sp. CCGB20 TaxID=2949633 RepID=UPI0020B2B6ED|nr:hypothetical protein [Bradyrhizobium sp. CCGB20]MCP3397838.1 hypothetical protein [Bradyrhizobium sp. CCGB20]